jgi:repressor LexA
MDRVDKKIVRIGQPDNLRRESRSSGGQDMTPDYTPKQGQYLAFIYYYTKLHGIPPAELDMQRYLRTTPPSVHQMVLTLEKRGFIERVPRQARSIRLLLPRDQLPDLD